MNNYFITMTVKLITFNIGPIGKDRLMLPYILCHVSQLLGCATKRYKAASAKQLATEYTLRGGEGWRSLLRAAAMTSHGSALVSTVTLVNTVT
jgi:hypothetical protein